MKAFIRKYKKRLIGIAILLIAYALFGRSSTKVAVPTEADTVAVTRGDIKSTLQVLGSTNLVTSQKLTFGAGGRVRKISVKQGDTVKKGQVLAEIDRRDADNDIRGQELAIQSAQITYDKLFSSTKPYQITQVKVNAESASGKVVTSQLELANLMIEKEIKVQEQQELIAEKEKSLAIINAQGTNTGIQDYSSQSVSAQNDALDSLQQARDALRTLEDIFYTNDPRANARVYIGGENDTLLPAADLAITKLKGAIEKFDPLYNTYVSTTPKTLDVVLALQSANKDLLNQFSLTAKAAGDAINGSLIDTRYYTNTTFQSNKTTISSMNSKVISLLNSINNNIKQSQSNDTDRLSIQNSIDAAKRNIDKLKLDYDLKIAQAQNDIITNQGSAQVNSENAASLIAGPTDDEKAAIINQIAQAQLGLTKSKKQLEDYQIIAQFDGTATAIDFKVGDQVTQLSEGITIEVPGIYEVNVLFDQLDIVKINLGQEATVVFDAYSEETFTGVISEIDPTPQTDQGVVSYQATIVLEKGGKNIYNEMSATVDVILEKKVNALIIPSLAVTSKDGKKTVQIRNNGSLQAQEITVGINDGKNVEVLSGLEEGQKITTKEFKITSKTKGFSLVPSRGTGQRMQPNSDAGAR